MEVGMEVGTAMATAIRPRPAARGSRARGPARPGRGRVKTAAGVRAARAARAAAALVWSGCWCCCSPGSVGAELLAWGRADDGIGARW